MSPEIGKNSNEIDQIETMLQQSLLMVEVGIDLKDRYVTGTKYLNYLKEMMIGAEKIISGLQIIAKTSLLNAQKVVLSNMPFCNEVIKNDYTKLMSVIERQLNDIDDVKDIDSDMNMTQVSEKIRVLESKHRLSDMQLCVSSKSIKADIDEKYPENLSKDSLIDLNTVVNLPPVPEDIFTSFSNIKDYKPTRSSSLSSLKSMRKVKLFLQKAESDEEDLSDIDDHEFAKLEFGDADDTVKSNYLSTSKKHLGNITEETQD